LSLLRESRKKKKGERHHIHVLMLDLPVAN
jgi:hypothetical protein